MPTRCVPSPKVCALAQTAKAESTAAAMIVRMFTLVIVGHLYYEL